MDYQLTCSFNEVGRHWEAALSGEIDIFNAVDLKNELVEVFTKNNADIHLDCQELSYIDSTGLGALVGIHKAVNEGGHVIRLDGLRPSIIKLFKITNLDMMFDIEGGAGNG